MEILYWQMNALSNLIQINGGHFGLIFFALGNLTIFMYFPCQFFSFFLFSFFFFFCLLPDVKEFTGFSNVMSGGGHNTQEVVPLVKLVKLVKPVTSPNNIIYTALSCFD